MNAMVLLRGGAAPGWAWIGVGAIALIVFGSWIITKVLEQRRRRAYAAFCPSRGFTYEPNRTDAEAPYARIVEVFTEGYDHKWRHIISGQFNGHPFTTFEYVFTTGYGKSATTQHLAMVHWERADAGLPQFMLDPENFFQRIGWAVGKDIEFPDDPIFSKACTLTGPDPEAVRALFTPAVRAALTPIRGQHLAGSGKELFWWKDGDLPDPDQFDAYLTELDGVRNLFLKG